jgi:hypothetical protein
VCLAGICFENVEEGGPFDEERRGLTWITLTVIMGSIMYFLVALLLETASKKRWRWAMKKKDMIPSISMNTGGDDREITPLDDGTTTAFTNPLLVVNNVTEKKNNKLKEMKEELKAKDYQAHLLESELKKAKAEGLKSKRFDDTMNLLTHDDSSVRLTRLHKSSSIRRAKKNRETSDNKSLG